MRLVDDLLGMARITRGHIKLRECLNLTPLVRLWLQAPGIEALLPPPEERKSVETAIGAARAEQSRRSVS